MGSMKLGRKLQYYLNDLLVRNPLWQIFILVLFSAAVVGLGILLVESHRVCDEGETPFWWSLTRLMDQGTFVDDHGNDAHSRLVAVFITICGVLVMSTLIGTFSSKITERLDYLKRGRSPVAEKGHYIVCGNGDRIYEVTRELLKARNDEPPRKRAALVMFSESSREEMEELLAQRTGKRSVRDVICRTGCVTDIDSLRLCGFDACRGFVILGKEDSSVLKTLIAVSALCDGNEPASVCEIRDERMKSISKMAHESVVTVPVREVVMRLLVQICRQPGLSAVYKEILSFSGSEFYFCDSSEVEGLAFGDAAARLATGVAVGVQRNGAVKLNPPVSHVLGSGDRLLVLAEDRGSIRFSDPPAVAEGRARGTKPCGNLFRMLVFSGSSTRFGLMLKLLDRYSPGGARIVVAGSLPLETGEGLIHGLECSNCSLEYVEVDRTDPEAVKALAPQDYDSILVVSGKAPGETDEMADSQSIVTLLILKDIRRSLKDKWNGTVVAEIRNPRNRRLATAAEIDDFVISNEVCSMIMAQLVKQRELAGVFREMFDPRGCEIHLRCRDQYWPGTFRELEAQGRMRNEVVLGWLTGSGSDSRVTLNPPREEVMPGDSDCRIVTIAER